MLRSLHIKNLAIIDEIDIQFSGGLNIITGETGAGKSLIIKAIQLLLGKKFSSELLRSGEDTLVVEGEFYEFGISTTIRRIYTLKGQSKTYINEETVTQKKLNTVTSKLADLHGQHDHQNLLNPQTHIDYLDAFGDYLSDIQKLEKIYLDREKSIIKLMTLQIHLEEYEEKKELHDFQLEELTQHTLSDSFEKEIISNHNQLANANALYSGLDTAKQSLTGGSTSVISQYLTSIANLKPISQFNPAIENILNRLESQRIEIEDIIQEIETIANGIVIDDNELEKLSSTIGDLESLKRKYGGTLDSVINYRDKLLKKTMESESYSEDIKRVKEENNSLNQELISAAKNITKLRKTMAKSLEESIQKNLKHLNMPKTELKIEINSDYDSINANGADSVEFYISTNIGENLRPLSKIASGGEISRIMLAIKMSLQSKDMVGTLIFDEVDSGISGETADRVGNTIQSLANSHQIICITHLSQIAGKGGSHYKVGKQLRNGRNVSQIKKLKMVERIEEIASLISGKNISNMSMEKAKELLQENG